MSDIIEILRQYRSEWENVCPDAVMKKNLRDRMFALLDRRTHAPSSEGPGVIEAQRILAPSSEVERAIPEEKPSPLEAVEVVAAECHKQRGRLMTEREKEIEARLKAATPGPWRRNGMRWIVTRQSHPLCQVSEPFHRQIQNGTGQDEEFIANAPSDIAYLLAALRRAKHDARAEAFEEAADDTICISRDERGPSEPCLDENDEPCCGCELISDFRKRAAAERKAAKTEEKP